MNKKLLSTYDQALKILRNRTVHATEVKLHPDKKDEEELEQAHQEAKIQSIIESNFDKAANRKLRKKYARKVFYYLIGYSISAFFLIIAAGEGYLNLSENVLMMIVGSTGVSAIGLVKYVIKGLFNDSN